MILYHFREAIVYRKGVVGLRQIRNGFTHDEGVLKHDVFDSLNLRRQRKNTGGPRARDEALRGQADPHAALGLAHIIVRTHEAEVEFIDRGSVKGVRVTQANKLRAAQVQRAKSGNASAALSRRKRVAHPVVTEEIV